MAFRGSESEPQTKEEDEPKKIEGGSNKLARISRPHMKRRHRVLKTRNVLRLALIHYGAEAHKNRCGGKQ
jgi:hypothetical protein